MTYSNHWASALSPGLLVFCHPRDLTTGMALCQAPTSCCRAAVHFVNPFSAFRTPWASMVIDETSKGTREPVLPKQKGRGAHLEIHHPVGHQGHHDGQELHQHPEVGDVFLGGRARLVRPLVRQQPGALRVSGTPDKMAAVITSTMATTFTSTIIS